MANEELERSLEDLREMESVLINVDRDKEEMVRDPIPTRRAARRSSDLSEAEDLFAEYRGRMLTPSLAPSAPDVAPALGNVWRRNPLADRGGARAGGRRRAAALDGESSATNETDETARDW